MEDVPEPGPLRSGEFLVLASLQRAPLHGYGISQAVRDRTSGRVRLRPGNLYRVLDRLLERGLIELADRKPARDRDDQRRVEPAAMAVAHAPAEARFLERLPALILTLAHALGA